MSTQLVAAPPPPKTAKTLPAEPLPLPGSPPRALHTVALSLFTLTIFSSATLLFIVQPMVGKILLPKLGGAPAVWNTCMLFFQATLLAGYLAAHLLSRHAALRAQVALFAVALMLVLQTLPFAVSSEWTDSLLKGTDPNLWLLTILVTRVAPVFFVMSMTSPLLQKWFAQSGHPQGRDPYFLYAASNIGSILALLAYPILIEVQWGVTAQTHFWKYGFAGFAGLATLCGIVSYYGSTRTANDLANGHPELPGVNGFGRVEATPPNWRRRGRWVLLSAIPSSLMLGITTYVSTDVSAIPLIWVIPLTVYLLTFVIAFSSRQWVSAYWMSRIAALLFLTIIVTIVTGANDPPSVIIPMHLVMFFTVAMYCHQRLSNDRPGPEHLTDFYLWLSVGGVVGGLLNALLAPALFVTTIEYPLVMVLAAMMRETRPDESTSSPRWHQSTVAFGAGVFLIALVLNYFFEQAVPEAWFERLAASSPFGASQWRTLLTLGIPACLVFHHLEHRWKFSAGLAAILLMGYWNYATDETLAWRGRNFYGTIRTVRETGAYGEAIKMYHGNTLHGWQWADPDRSGIPLAYYGAKSGVGRLIARRQASTSRPLNIGAIGLGAGTLAATLRPGDAMTYYEINPQVLDHAERYFTYLSDARRRGATVETRLGDARLVLESETRAGQTGVYDILVVDAFSSDSIPVHLMTDECLKSYLTQLRHGGTIAFHISNRFLDLEPVLTALAHQNGLVGYGYHFREIEHGAAFDEKTGETASSWILLGRDAADLKLLEGEGPLQPLRSVPGMRPWTDDYSNVLSAFELRL